MSEFIPPLEILIEQFQHLPGIGRKTAQRLAFSIVDSDEETVLKFRLFNSKELDNFDEIKKYDLFENYKNKAISYQVRYAKNSKEVISYLLSLQQLMKPLHSLNLYLINNLLLLYYF